MAVIKDIDESQAPLLDHLIEILKRLESYSLQAGRKRFSRLTISKNQFDRRYCGQIMTKSRKISILRSSSQQENHWPKLNETGYGGLGRTDVGCLGIINPYNLIASLNFLATMG